MNIDDPIYYLYARIDGFDKFIGETPDLETAFKMAAPYVEKGISVAIGEPNSGRNSVVWPGLIGHYRMVSVFEDVIEAQVTFENKVREIMDERLPGEHDLWNFEACLQDYMNQHNGMMKDSWVKHIAKLTLAEQGHRNMIAEISRHGYDSYNGDVGWKDNKAYRNGIELLGDDPYWDLHDALADDYDDIDEPDYLD